MNARSLLRVGFLIGCVGCRSATLNPYQVDAEVHRDTVRAQELCHQAVDLIETDAERAESLLREALVADLFYGPAHNNLGVLLLEGGELYEAANEFEWARKLMPGHPDPRLNLALTLEKAGQSDEALKTYRTALEVYPEHLPSQQALARLSVRVDPDDADLPALLEHVALRGETAAWREWARLRLASMDGR